MDTTYAQLAKKARDQVQELEEPFKSLAFQTILQELIQEAKRPSQTTVRKSKTPTSGDQAEDPVQIFLTTVVDEKNYAKLFASKGRLAEKSLAVLKLARDVLGIDGLTASQISEILTRKFRVSKVYRQNVSNDLRKSTNYVHRIQSGSDYKYLLMTVGEEHLEEVASQSR